MNLLTIPWRSPEYLRYIIPTPACNRIFTLSFYYHEGDTITRSKPTSLFSFRTCVYSVPDTFYPLSSLSTFKHMKLVYNVLTARRWTIFPGASVWMVRSWLNLAVHCPIHNFGCADNTLSHKREDYQKLKCDKNHCNKSCFSDSQLFAFAIHLLW